ncbi:class-II fumarase/aspartase family protein [Streptomyces chiangmaiensis]|nr:adenylosuccinate lyase family protein [Streptomyces chiangmaiensis]
MGARLTDSSMYAHLWGTFETRALFEETGRLQSWLDILVALARAQADLGIIPRHAADAIAGQARVELLDLDHVAEETRRTSHSTLGLIRGLQQILPEQAREHVYFGATVQDLTDTWFGIVMREVGSLLREDLRSVEAVLLQLASRHRDTVMAGRTHGQPGAPVTFGFKVAGWADEIRRHIERLHEGRDRWAVGQLGGAVGVLGFFEGDGLELRRLFCRHLRLADPGISWLTSRDRPAEFAGVLAMICGTLARVGADVYELQRPEIGELREPAPPGGVSSITMPHKRNPENSEHLDTLARLARGNAGILLEGMVQQHERDGRGWKAEWVALPEICLLTARAVRTAHDLLAGLEVDPDAMAANVTRHGDRMASERVLAALSERLGKHRAQAVLQDVLREQGAGADLAAALQDRGLATQEEIRTWVRRSAVGTAGRMVDDVVHRGHRAREQEPQTWR